MAEPFAPRDARPGLHALVVGVSEYGHLLSRDDRASSPEHHLGLRKLDTAARAAWRIYDWLVKHADHLDVPLASCRLLLSPSDAESKLADWAPRATLDNFGEAASAWRSGARTNPKNLALFYFAGHGLQRSDNSEVLLFEEFGGNPDKKLGKCLEVANLTEGMASMSQDDTMARTQLYFLDACRSLPGELCNYNRVDAESIWDIKGKDPTKPFIDSRFAPVFFTLPGSQAFGIPDVGSVFGETLLACLDGGAGKFDPEARRWTVTCQSLIESFKAQLDRINRRYKSNQVVTFSKYDTNAPLLYSLERPPLVEIEITVKPSCAHHGDRAQILLHDEKLKLFRKISPIPVLHQDKIPAGNYQVSAIVNLTDQPSQRIDQLLTATPPHTPWSLIFE